MNWTWLSALPMLILAATPTVAQVPPNPPGYVDPDAAPPPPAPPKRRAILIGMNEFRPEGYVRPAKGPVMLGNLATPCLGSAELSQKLHTLGWKDASVDSMDAEENEIFQFCNADLSDLHDFIQQSIEGFDNENDLLVIYLAGHGAKVGGKNYFFRSQAKVDIERAAERYIANPDNTLFLGQAMDLGATISGAAGLSYRGNILLVVDTCRDDPINALLVNKIKQRAAIAPIVPPFLDADVPGVMAFYATGSSYRVADNPTLSGKSYLVEALLAKLRVGAIVPQIVVDAQRKVVEDTKVLSQQERQVPQIVNSLSNLTLCIAGCGNFAARAEPDKRPVRLASLSQRGELASIDALALKRLLQPVQKIQTPSPWTIHRVAEVKLEQGVQRNVDIYWCRGGPEETRLKEQALGLGRALSGSAREFSESGLRLGRVRSTWLDVTDNRAPSFGVAANVIRFDYADVMTRDFAERLKQVSDGKLGYDSVRASSGGVIPVFFCEGAEVHEPTRLWIQAASEQQRPLAVSLAAQMKTSGDNLLVADKIQVLPVISPRATQVRYFYAQDLEVANALSNRLAATFAKRPETIFLSNYQKNVKPGLIELWIGKDVDPEKSKLGLSPSGRVQTVVAD